MFDRVTADDRRGCFWVTVYIQSRYKWDNRWRRFWAGFVNYSRIQPLLLQSLWTTSQDIEVLHTALSSAVDYQYKKDGYRQRNVRQFLQSA